MYDWLARWRQLTGGGGGRSGPPVSGGGGSYDPWIELLDQAPDRTKSGLDAYKPDYSKVNMANPNNVFTRARDTTQAYLKAVKDPEYKPDQSDLSKALDAADTVMRHQPVGRAFVTKDDIYAAAYEAGHLSPSDLGAVSWARKAGVNIYENPVEKAREAREAILREQAEAADMEAYNQSRAHSRPLYPVQEVVEDGPSTSSTSSAPVVPTGTVIPTGPTGPSGPTGLGYASTFGGLQAVQDIDEEDAEKKKKKEDDDDDDDADSGDGSSSSGGGSAGGGGS